jgi:hypothetical protein
MNAPATLYRRLGEDEVNDDARPGWQAGGAVVAQGPLGILAHGLLAVPPGERDTLWIRTDSGDLLPAQVEALLAP